jgi:hypothetical protein
MMVVRGRQTSSLEQCCGLRETGDEEERTRWVRMRLESARSKQSKQASKQAPGRRPSKRKGRLEKGSG